jgi:hypothetical protein
LSSNGRHLRVTLIILAQYPIQLPSELRSQVDIVFLLMSSNARTLGLIHTEFASCTPLRVFKSVVTSITKNHGVLVINNRRSSADISEVCSHTRVPWPPTIVKMGSEALWRWAREHYFDLGTAQKLAAVARNNSIDDVTGDTDNEDDDDNTTSHMDMLTPEALSILDNRSLFTDRSGTILIRTSLSCKTKID